MAQKKENIKMLFTNTRSRVIIVFTAIIMLVAIVIGLTKFFRVVMTMPFVVKKKSLNFTNAAEKRIVTI